MNPNKNKIIFYIFELGLFTLLYFISNANIKISIAGMVLSSLIKLYYILYKYGRINFQDEISAIFIIISGTLTIVFDNLAFFQIKAMITTAIIGLIFIILRIKYNKSLLDLLAIDIPINKENKSLLDIEIGALFFSITFISFVYFILNKHQEWFLFKVNEVPAIFFIYLILRLYSLANQIFNKNTLK